MSNPANPLPSGVRDALRGGNKVEAIRRLRQATGLGLKEAKDLVEAHALRKSAPRSPASPSAPTVVPVAIAEAIQRGSVLDAIKMLRDHQSPGLKEAKAAVEDARASAARGFDGPPDTFNRVVNALWWVLALILGGVATYYLLR